MRDSDTVKDELVQVELDQEARSDHDVPLVVDLDGTLVKVDTLHEGFVQLAVQHPLDALRALHSLREGRGAFKAALAEHILPDMTALPMDQAVLEHIRQARQSGRQVFLATAADKRVAQRVADVVGGFDGVFASENGINLKGEAKAEALVAAFGVQGFDYIGNDAVDLPVWQVARSALATGCSSRFMCRLNDAHPSAVLLSAKAGGVGPYIRALRPHQWLKNLLVVLPVVASHDYSLAALVTVIIAFVSFSLCASSVYLVNDILDLPHDRAHPEKRHRPFAAGVVPLTHGLGLFAVAAGLALATALLLPWPFLLALGSYFGLSMAYATLLKRKLMIDVVALAALYGIRVLAGGAATGIVLSDWLVGFCFFMFLSLALVKRGTELMAQPDTATGKIKGRGYRPADLPIVHALTVASGLVAILVLALYINSPEVRLLYSRPELLWGMCMMLVYWLGRVFFLTGRGEMRQDPVIFAVTDRNSLITGAVVAAIFLLAL